jgi:hypothetical protein
MRGVLNTLTHGRRNKFIDCQKAKDWITIISIIDVKTRWNSIVELLEGANTLREFTPEWLKTPKYHNYWPIFTPQDEWTGVKDFMEGLRPIWHWILWMSKWHTISLHLVMAV